MKVFGLTSDQCEGLSHSGVKITLGWKRDQGVAMSSIE